MMTCTITLYSQNSAVGKNCDMPLNLGNTIRPTIMWQIKLTSFGVLWIAVYEKGKKGKKFYSFLKFYWPAPLLTCHSFYGYDSNATYKYIHELLSLLLLRTNTTRSVSSNFQIFILFHKEKFECPFEICKECTRRHRDYKCLLNCVKIFIIIEVYHQSILEALHVVLNLPQLPHLDLFTLKDTGIKTNWYRYQNHCNLLELKSILYHIDRDKYYCA